MPSLLTEYTRPWKLLTLLAGVALMVAGALADLAPDWDVPISFIMPLLTYLTAPWSMRVVLQRRWRHFPLMLLFTWFTVDGVYSLYWHFKAPDVLALMRYDNFITSLPLYGICGLFWLYQGSLSQFIAEVKGKLNNAEWL